MSELGPASPSCLVNQGPMVLAVSYALLATAIITIALRVHIRIGLRTGLNTDDYTIIASLIAGIIGTAGLTKLVYAGLGRHVWCLPKSRVSSAVKWSTISQMLNVIGIGLAKISVALCVLRIIDRTRVKLTIFLQFVIVLAAASHLAQVILFIVQCRPMSAIWNPHIQGAKCFSPHITYLAGYIGFGLDAGTDLICAGIPIFILHRLHINQRTKLALCCLMGLGSLTAGCAIAKAVLLENIFATDYTYAITKPAICTIVEHLSSMTLVSLPALKPLFNKLLEASFTSPFTSPAITKRSSRSTPPVHRGYYFRRHHHNHRSPANPNDSYVSSKSLRSTTNESGTPATERGDIPLCDGILKTTQFRVSSRNSVVGSSEGGQGEKGSDEWPLPLGRGGTVDGGDGSGGAGADVGGGKKLAMGNSWRVE
ncbi:hypothetical protein ACLMJK_000384 [Lecanora helva]